MHLFIFQLSDCISAGDPITWPPRPSCLAQSKSAELQIPPHSGLQQFRDDETNNAFCPSVRAWVGCFALDTIDRSPGQFSAPSTAPSIIPRTVYRGGFVVGKRERPPKGP